MSDNYREIDPYALIWANDLDIADMLRRREDSYESIAQYFINKHQIARDDRDIFDRYFEELPTNEGGFMDVLNRGYNHIIKATDKSGKFRVYDYDSGVWVDSGKPLADGRMSQDILTEILSGYERATVRSAEFMLALIGLVFPPQPRPSSKDVMELSIYLARESVVREIRRKHSSFVNTAENIRGRSYSNVMRQWATMAAYDESLWDSNMRWVVCEDATIDLDLVMNDFNKRIFECVVPHSPEHMSTNQVHATTEFLNIDYVDTGDSDLPTESKFITGVARTLPDASIREFLQARFGVALYGTPGEFGKAMVWQFGESDTAKSSIQEVIAGQNGVFSQYSWTANSSVLCVGNRGASDTEASRFKAMARGKRYVLINELEDGAKLSQTVVKSLTGGDTVYGDTKYGSEVNYSFTATIFMASNHGPKLPEGDTALASRLLVVPFNHHYWVQEKSPQKWLDDKLNRANPRWVEEVLSDSFERSMILLWVLEGARKYFYKGIGKSIPDAIQKAGDKFKNEADLVSQTVMTMLGINDDADGVRQSYRIYSDTEWESYGNSDSDGVLMTDFKKAFSATLGELGLMDDFTEKHLKKYMDAAVKYIDEKFDARLDTVRLSGGTRRKVFTRMMPYTDQTTVKQIIQDEQEFNIFKAGLE